MRSLPVIDWALYRSSDRAARCTAVESFAAAGHALGFFYLKNHPIASATQRSLFATAERFFAQPEAARIAVQMSGALRGYEPMQRQALDETAPPDIKESFYYSGMPDARASDRWPQGLPGFREELQSYGAQMATLGNELFQCLALSLDLDAGYFAAGIAEPSCTVRLLHYPPQPARPLTNQLGAGAHTDWGAITILLQDDCGGLQIRDSDGTWVDAAPMEGTLVINLGDMVPRWTNDRYHSSMHRVINKSAERDRYSVACFFNPHAGYRVACVPTCLPTAGEPRYPACTVGEHVQEMARRTYGAGNAQGSSVAAS
jgi:isopenicillin N synthase-like dioxygenase